MNQRFIRDYLATESIPIESEDLGGTQGRVIHFYSDSFRVFRRFIRKNETAIVEKGEHEYWKAAVAEPKPAEGEAVFF